MLWIALALFILWILGVIGNIGVGIHTVLLVALGFFVVGLTGRAASGLTDEAERTSAERGAALDRGEKPRGGELNK